MKASKGARARRIARRLTVARFSSSAECLLFLCFYCLFLRLACYPGEKGRDFFLLFLGVGFLLCDVY